MGNSTEGEGTELNPSVNRHGRWLPCWASVFHSCLGSFFLEKDISKESGAFYAPSIHYFIFLSVFTHTRDVGCGGKWEGVGLSPISNFSTQRRASSLIFKIFFMRIVDREKMPMAFVEVGN